jgi:AraC-like DNA-binding protein/quercetin dioxygenase-like cupin family protein
MKISGSKSSDLSWLAEVRESKQPLNEQSPIWVRHGVIKSGPTIPHPEVHPYCEFSTIQKGAAVAFVGREMMERQSGDYFLAGPGLAHWYEGLKYPVKFIAIYFLPSLLIDLGPINDGMQILRRFTAHQSLAQRVVRPPSFLASRFTAAFAEAVAEFDQKSFGHEIRLRTLLVEMLVQLLRWEKRAGKELRGGGSAASWPHIAAALQYLSQHFTDDIYARDLAAVAGVSESRLKVLFQEMLGMPWTHYLRGYRIHRAAALLCQPNHNVLEACLAVGFQSLSHFNATFRSVMGVNPSIYAKRAAGRGI